MKKILSTVILVLLSASLSFAQDSRGRVPATVVSDVLAVMPVNDPAVLAGQVRDLAVSAPATVEILAARLVPASEGQNALAEYALSAVAAYFSDPAHAAYRDAVREGFSKAVAAQTDPVNRQFLLDQLRMIAAPEDIALYRKYVADPLSGAAAVQTIAALGGKDTILELIDKEAAPKAVLADVAAACGYVEAAPKLLQWANAAADPVEKGALARALARVGGEAALPWLKAHAPADYAAAIADLPAEKAVKAAKALLKEGTSSQQCAAAGVFMQNAPVKDGLKMLANLLKSDDRALRNAALSAATEAYGVAAVVPALTGKFKKLGEGARTDVVNWLGLHRQAEDVVVSQMDAPGELGDAAVRSAGLYNSLFSRTALVMQLSGEKAPQALTALKSFPGDVTGAVVAGLQAPVNNTQLENLMALASAREIKQAAPQVLDQVAKGSAPAAAALAGVVTPAEAEAVANLLGKVPEDQVPALQNALGAALHTLSPGDRTARAKELMDASTLPARFYPVVARTGTDEAVAILRECASTDAEARKALLSMDNPAICPDLLSAAKEGDEAALKRYIDLLSAYEQNADKKRFGLAEAIGLAKNPELRVRALGKLGDMPYMKTFLLAGKSLDDPDAGVRMAAAEAVKKIASKATEEINYDDLKANLEKARAVFAARGTADDGYAMDEIDKMLLEAKPSPRSELTAEEKARGFEMLFDGTDLSKWHGDMEGYTVVNGTIYVSANYGATGNLYTNKEYRNFVYRFEFCFLQEGVNNGVGIRTPENVDAAYEGMCELQILDHDAPAYAGWLRDYQVHGSIYGVVPAKRIKHKPLGEWSTEEIIVEGDHIKVTVNGEVITDANVRKVTKGHNVAPDGGKENPYTIDRHNHPGMFNEKGYISFCGHGAGLKIRNVRILDLGNKK